MSRNNKKEISLNKFQSILKPNEELSFGEKSPITPITTPPTTIFVAWHGNLLMNCTGTCYVCRDDRTHLNFDVYSILSTKKDKNLEIINSKQNYHWIEKEYKKIPEFIRNTMPKQIEEKVKKIIED